MMRTPDEVWQRSVVIGRLWGDDLARRRRSKLFFAWIRYAEALEALLADPIAER